MVLLYKWCQLAQVTKRQHHSYSCEQNCQLECNRYPCRQCEERFTTKVELPIDSQCPGNKSKRSHCTGDTIYKTGCMQARITQPHCFIQPVDREWSKYIMDLITGTTHFFHRGKKYRLVIKTTNYEFFTPIVLLFVESLTAGYELRASSCEPLTH